MTVTVEVVPDSGVVTINEGDKSVVVIQPPTDDNGDIPSQGDFIPSLAFGGASDGVSYVTRIGRYTKINRLLFFEIVLTLTSKGISTGPATITGLPFAAIAWVVVSMWVDNINQGGSTTFYQPRIENGGTVIFLNYNTNGVNGQLANTNVSDNSNFIVTGFYSVDE